MAKIGFCHFLAIPTHHFFFFLRFENSEKAEKNKTVRSCICSGKDLELYWKKQSL